MGFILELENTIEWPRKFLAPFTMSDTALLPTFVRILNSRSDQQPCTDRWNTSRLLSKTEKMRMKYIELTDAQMFLKLRQLCNGPFNKDADICCAY